jgi:hypothetical protein
MTALILKRAPLTVAADSLPPGAAGNDAAVLR